VTLKELRWVTLRARWVTLRARWVTLRASLGDAESSLGDAKSSLGDAESSPGDAKSFAGVAQPVTLCRIKLANLLLRIREAAFHYELLVQVRGSGEPRRGSRVWFPWRAARVLVTVFPLSLTPDGSCGLGAQGVTLRTVQAPATAPDFLISKLAVRIAHRGGWC
jgi:hypothetical protein